MVNEDMDECKFNISDCDVNANCTNTYGSYKCTCKVGYNGDGRSCSVTTIYIFCYTFCNDKRNYMTMGHKNDKVKNL
ncbi:hypothetical protein pdam_00021081 [Pocillopora damicornis]|uniref:EGF-like domain-containing protein n=1 Tax=Pocillopora damicornis TaxID=46731 RepID=A0A3M6TRJ1_POCDA|nr:hypothetical protein pdam_00021081 [Pocillopora damicornis]